MPLSVVTFEPNSKLRLIEAYAFTHCHLLESVFLPGSLQSFKGLSFFDCGLRQIQFAPENEFFHSVGDFVMDLKKDCLVRYFGSDSQVTIPDQVKILGPGCFNFCSSLVEVTFKSTSTLEWIESEAFCECIHLESIHFPSSLLHIEGHCFRACCSLHSVSFNPDSKLLMIGRRAFWKCVNLTSLVIPSSVECVGKYCFTGCLSLRSFVFSEPSHVWGLRDLPPIWEGMHNIPDSVENLEYTASRINDHSSEYWLQFGSDSQLKYVEPAGESLVTKVNRSFLHVSSRSLKLFRLRLEFASNQ
jgi:hypothetical protein